MREQLTPLTTIDTTNILLKSLIWSDS